ncbi:hypothetical protein Tco_1341030, partial [Tanacetum coccineum]
MEEGMASNLIRTQRLEDVPELINKIQSLLGRKEAARTCVLSKSWLYAWSKIPNLRGPRTIKVENLCRLRVMKTKLMRNQNMEIVGVPNLHMFSYESLENITKTLPFDMDSLRRVSHLLLAMIMYKFIAPKISTSCVYEGYTIPNLLFPTITPEQIKLSLRLDAPIELTLFLKMRGILNISSKFDIEILLTPSNSLVSLNTSITELRKCVPIPAPNVQQLSILTSSDHILWENSPLFDTFFLFVIPPT